MTLSLKIFKVVGEINTDDFSHGNQARVRPGATVISTSTRNFDNRLGDGTRVYLGTTELTAISSLMGACLPPVSTLIFWRKRNYLLSDFRGIGYVLLGKVDHDEE